MIYIDFCRFAWVQRSPEELNSIGGTMIYGDSADFSEVRGHMKCYKVLETHLFIVVSAEYSNFRH